MVRSNSFGHVESVKWLFLQFAKMVKSVICTLTDNTNAMILATDYDWVRKTLRTCEMYLG